MSKIIYDLANKNSVEKLKTFFEFKKQYSEFRQKDYSRNYYWIYSQNDKFSCGRPAILIDNKKVQTLVPSRGGFVNTELKDIDKIILKFKI